MGMSVTLRIGPRFIGDFPQIQALETAPVQRSFDDDGPLADGVPPAASPAEPTLPGWAPATAAAAVRGRAEGDGDPATVYGALDLGTNNCRLLVARPSRRGFLVIDAFSRIIRLGEGVSHSGRLSEAAMARTLEALRVCADKLKRRNVERYQLVATEACRVAGNAPEFLQRVQQETGLNIEIVSRETEARLALAGCASLIDRNCDYALVFDIGGGSSELVFLDLNKRAESHRNGAFDRIDAQSCVVAWTSLPVGVVTLSERFGGRHVGNSEFEQMVGFVHGLLGPFEAEHRIRERMHGASTHMLGTSGTVTTVAGINLGLKAYDRSRVDGCWLLSSDVRRVSSGLLDLSYDGRVAEPCIGRDRADLVLAGCAILEALLQQWPCERLRVADRGLREGILATLIAEDGAQKPRRWRRPW